MKFRIRFHNFYNNSQPKKGVIIHQFIDEDTLEQVYQNDALEYGKSKYKIIDAYWTPLYPDDGDFDYECDSFEDLMIAFPEYFL